MLINRFLDLSEGFLTAQIDGKLNFAFDCLIIMIFGAWKYPVMPILYLRMCLVGSSLRYPTNRFAYQAYLFVMEIYAGKRVAHWKTERQGTVIQWYTEGKNAKKMWILFDDGEVELRWIKAFVEI